MNPAMRNAMTIAGPALFFACVPVRVKIPVPMTIPMPNPMRSHAVRFFASDPFPGMGSPCASRSPWASTSSIDFFRRIPIGRR
jgi:hypothetical protein